MEKREIRNKILKLRNELSTYEVEYKSNLIFNNLSKLVEYKTADIIYIYMDFRNEVRTNKIIEDVLISKRKVACPKVIGDTMKFYFINSIDDLERGYFNIMEPKEGLEIANENCGTIIVPGSVFDKNGYRIGYGKGFYDMYLSSFDRLYKIGLSYEIQLVDKIPYETYDIKLNNIITEDRIIDC